MVGFSPPPSPLTAPVFKLVFQANFSGPKWFPRAPFLDPFGSKNRPEIGSEFNMIFALILVRFLELKGTPKGGPNGAGLVSKMASDFQVIFGSVLDALSEALEGLPCVTVRRFMGSRGRENYRFLRHFGS